MPWNQPLSSIVEISNRGYQSGMQSGDVESAFMNFFNRVQAVYFSGKPLSAVIKDCESLVTLLDQYCVASVAPVIRPTELLLQSLAGTKKQPLAWAREVLMDTNLSSVDNSTVYVAIWSYLSAMQLAYLLGEYDLANELSCKLRKVMSADFGFFAPTNILFFTGLVATAMFRKAKRRTFRKQATTAAKALRELMKGKGPLNILHRCLILEAELAAVSAKTEDTAVVKEKFDGAIRVAKRAGFLHDAALATELAGIFHMQIDDNISTSHYLTEAHGLYRSWGARAKVDELETRRRHFIRSGESIWGSSGMFTLETSGSREIVRAVKLHGSRQHSVSRLLSTPSRENSEELIGRRSNVIRRSELLVSGRSYEFSAEMENPIAEVS